MPPVCLLIKPVSGLCNMRCRYCFYRDEIQSRTSACTEIMQEDTLEALVRQAFAYASDSICFAFQGGEPTLAGLPFFQKLIQLQRQYRTGHIAVHNSIQTNGLQIDEAWAAFLAENHFLVGISLDGNRELHDSMRLDANGNGTFGRVIRAVRLLKKYGVAYNILCVVTDTVAKHPIQVYEALKAFRYLQFIPCLDSLDGIKTAYTLKEEHYASFLQQTFALYYRDFKSNHYVSIRNFDNYIQILLGNQPESCAMHGFCSCYGVVESDGSVYPCDFYALDAWKLGNIRTEGLADMLQGDIAKAFIQRSLPVPTACKNCAFYRLCRNGCCRERVGNGTAEPSQNRHCAAFRAFFTEKLPQMMEMAQLVKCGLPVK